MRYSQGLSDALYEKVKAYCEQREDKPTVAQVVREAVVAYLRERMEKE